MENEAAKRREDAKADVAKPRLKKRKNVAKPAEEEEVDYGKLRRVDLEQIKLVYPSPHVNSGAASIQEDKQEYVKPRAPSRDRKSRKPKRKYARPGIYATDDPDRHHTVEEYRPKKKKVPSVRYVRHEGQVCQT